MLEIMVWVFGLGITGSLFFVLWVFFYLASNYNLDVKDYDFDTGEK